MSVTNEDLERIERTYIAEPRAHGISIAAGGDMSRLIAAIRDRDREIAELRGSSRCESFGCVKNTIRLRSGRYFDFLDPQPDQFTLADIAGALSKICRFGGQIERFYSVAEHLVMCDRVAERDGHHLGVRKAVLMHDAAEAFCGDMVKPLKEMMPAYKVVEARVEAVIAKKFGIDFDEYLGFVSEIDHAMLIAERRQLFSKDKVKWAGEDDVRPLHVMIEGWRPMDAEVAFVHRCLSVGISDIE
jgi:hypothetical protein